MDLDVIAKHMPGLIEFKKRIEALLEGAENGVGAVADGIKAEIADIRSHLSETADAVSSLQKLKDDIDATISAAINSVEEKFAAVTADLNDKLAEFSGIASWINENKQALEVLLSIGDDLETPKPSPVPEPAGATAAPQPEEPGTSAPVSDVGGTGISPATTDQPAVEQTNT